MTSLVVSPKARPKFTCSFIAEILLPNVWRLKIGDDHVIVHWCKKDVLRYKVSAGAPPAPPQYSVAGEPVNILAMLLSFWDMQALAKRGTPLILGLHWLKLSRVKAILAHSQALGFKVSAPLTLEHACQEALSFAMERRADLYKLDIEKDFEDGDPAPSRASPYCDLFSLESLVVNNVAYGVVVLWGILGPLRYTALREANTRMHRLGAALLAQSGSDSTISFMIGAVVSQWVVSRIIPPCAIQIPSSESSAYHYMLFIVALHSSDAALRRNAFGRIVIHLLRSFPLLIRLVQPTESDEECLSAIDTLHRYHSTDGDGRVKLWDLTLLASLESKLVLHQELVTSSADTWDLQLPETRAPERVAEFLLQLTGDAGVLDSAPKSSGGEGESSAATPDHKLTSSILIEAKTKKWDVLYKVLVALNAQTPKPLMKMIRTLFNAHIPVITATLLGRLRGVGNISPLMQLVAELVPDVADYFDASICADPKGARPPHTLDYKFHLEWFLKHLFPKVTEGKDLLNALLSAQDVHILQLAYNARAIAEDLAAAHMKTCPDWLDTGVRTITGLVPTPPTFYDLAHFDKVLIPFGIHDPASSSGNWCHGMDAIITFYQRGERFSEAHFADHLKCVRKLLTLLVESLLFWAPFLSQAAILDRIGQDLPFELLPRTGKFWKAHDSFLEGMAAFQGLAHQYPSVLGIAQAKASGSAAVSDLGPVIGSGSKGTKTGPNQGQGIKTGLAPATGGAVKPETKVKCYFRDGKLFIGAAVYHQAKILKALGRNASNLCLENFMRTVGKRGERCKRVGQPGHTSSSDDLHSVSEALWEMRPSFEHKPFRVDRGAKAAKAGAEEGGGGVEEESDKKKKKRARAGKVAKKAKKAKK